MMTGSVHSGEAILPLNVRGPRGATLSIQAVLDTGFDGWLTLSADQIAYLGLPYREEAHYVLADGSQTVSRLFEGEIDWFGRRRRILAVEMDGGPLVDMATLTGCSIAIDVIENGPVEIRLLR